MLEAENFAVLYAHKPITKTLSNYSVLQSIKP